MLKRLNSAVRMASTCPDAAKYRIRNRQFVLADDQAANGQQPQPQRCGCAKFARMLAHEESLASSCQQPGGEAGESLVGVSVEQTEHSSNSHSDAV